MTEQRIKIITYRGAPGKDADITPLLAIVEEIKGNVESFKQSQMLGNGVLDSSIKEIEVKVSELIAELDRVKTEDVSSFNELIKSLQNKILDLSTKKELNSLEDKILIMLTDAVSLVKDLSNTLNEKANKTDIEEIKKQIPEPIEIVPGSSNVSIEKENNTYTISVDVPAIQKQIVQGGGVSRAVVKDIVDAALVGYTPSGSASPSQPVDLTPYTLLTTTASISSNLQTQINNIVQEGTVIIGGPGITASNNGMVWTVGLSGSFGDAGLRSEVVAISGGLDTRINDIVALDNNQASQISALSGNSISQSSQIAQLSGNSISQGSQINTISGNNISQSSQIAALSGNSISQGSQINTISGNNISQSSQITSLSASVLILENVKSSTTEPRGFENRTSSTLSWNDSNRLFAISGSYNIWQNGIKYPKTGENYIIPNVTNSYYFYYDSTGAFQVSTSPWSILTDVPIALMFYNATDGKGILLEERHGIVMDSLTHNYLHSTRGTVLESLGTLNSYNLQETSPSITGQQWTVSETKIWDEDIKSTLANSSKGNYYGVYRSGASEWRITSGQTLPFLIGSTYIAYNQNNAGTWGLTDLTNSDPYCNYYVVAVPSVSSQFSYAVIPGQNVYGSVAAAEEESVSNLTLTGLPFVEVAFIYRITYRYSTTYTATNRGRIESVSAINSNAISTGITPVTNHNALTGIQGGLPGEHYHLSAAEISGYVGRTEVAAISSGLDTRINNIVALDSNQATQISAISGQNISQSSQIVSLSGNSISQGSQIVSLSGNSISQGSQIVSLSGNSISQASQIASISAALGTGGVSLAQVAAASANAQIQTSNNLSPLIFSISGNYFKKSGDTVSGTAIFSSVITSPKGTVAAYSEGFGLNALANNQPAGLYNVAVGTNSLVSNTSGYYNVGLGYAALYGNTVGYQNIGIGGQALYYNINGNNNVGIGYYALVTNKSGVNNNAVGASCLQNNEVGNNNCAFGVASLALNTSGSNNIGIGTGTGYSNLTGLSCINIGTHAGYTSTDGVYNINVGENNNYYNKGSYNTSVGFSSCVLMSGNSNYNTAVGAYSLYGFAPANVRTGSNNVAIGYGAGASMSGSNMLIIDFDAGLNHDARGAFIYGEFDTGTLLTKGNTIWHSGNLAQSTEVLQLSGGPLIMRSSNSGQSLSVARNIIIYEDSEYFVDGGSYAASGAYYVPEDGYYHVTATITPDAVSSETLFSTYIYVRENEYKSEQWREQASTSDIRTFDVDGLVYCNKGDYISIRFYTSIPYNLYSDSNYNRLAIWRIR